MSCRVHHKYAGFVGGVMILSWFLCFYSDLVCYSEKVVMDTNVSLQVSLDGPRDRHLCLVCLLHLTVCVVDYFC